MRKKNMYAFTSEVAEKLDNYVYRLIDPRNGETFYVGRGIQNRLYNHIQDELGKEGDKIDDKLDRIRQIRLSGFEVGHVVHRHGMNSETAKEVEAALIDAYPGLTNAMGGAYSAERGVMHANQIKQLYTAETAKIEDKALLISINRTALEMELYEAVRYAWKINIKKAREAELVLAVHKGIIKGCYIPEEWLTATATNFPGRADRPDRYGFIGHEAPAEIKEKYINRRIPENYQFGSANPIRYTW